MEITGIVFLSKSFFLTEIRKLSLCGSFKEHASILNQRGPGPCCDWSGQRGVQVEVFGEGVKEL